MNVPRRLPSRGAVGRAMRAFALWTSRILWVAVPLLLVMVTFSFADLGEPETLSTASVSTESVRFRVVDKDKSGFRVEKVKVRAPGSAVDGQCVTGLVAPALGVEVTYGRLGNGVVEITLAPRTRTSKGLVGAFQPEGHPDEEPPPSVALPSTTYMAPDSADPTCAGAAQVRLPIWGFADFGTEFRPANGPGLPEPSMLSHGTVKIAARSRQSKSLYDVTEFSVPVGSRLTTPDPCSSDPTTPGQDCADNVGIWWGTASIDPSANGLQVEAATISPVLQLFHPLRSDPDHISVSKLTQLKNDPDLIQVQFYLIVCTSIAGVTVALARHFGAISES